MTLPLRRIATIEQPRGDNDARKLVVWTGGDEVVVYGYVGAIPVDTLCTRRSQVQALIEALQNALVET